MLIMMQSQFNYVEVGLFFVAVIVIVHFTSLQLLSINFNLGTPGDVFALKIRFCGIARHTLAGLSHKHRIL